MSKHHQYRKTRRKRKQNLGRIHTLDEYLEIDRHYLINKNEEFTSHQIVNETLLANSSINDEQMKSINAAPENEVVVESNAPLTMDLRGCRKIDCVGKVVLYERGEIKDRKRNAALAVKDHSSMRKGKNNQNSNDESGTGVTSRSRKALHLSRVKVSNTILDELPCSPTSRLPQMISIKGPFLYSSLQQIGTKNDQQRILKLSHQSESPSMTSSLLVNNSCPEKCIPSDKNTVISRNVSDTLPNRELPSNLHKPFVIKVRPFGSEPVKRLCSPVSSNLLKGINSNQPSIMEVQNVSERDLIKLVEVGSSRLHLRTISRPESCIIPNSVREKGEKVFPVAFKSSESQDFQFIRTDETINEGDEILGL